MDTTCRLGVSKGILPPVNPERHELHSRPDTTSRVVLVGMLLLAAVGIVTVFGEGLWSLAKGDLSVQNP